MNRLEAEYILPLCLVYPIVYNLFPYGKRFICFWEWGNGKKYFRNHRNKCNGGFRYENNKQLYQ